MEYLRDFGANVQNTALMQNKMCLGIFRALHKWSKLMIALQVADLTEAGTGGSLGQ